MLRVGAGRGRRGTRIGPGTATDNLVARMTAAPAAARKDSIYTLIKALMDGGVWNKLDFLHVLAAHDSQAALLDWKGLYNATAVNTPTFTIDRGFAGNGTTSYVDTGFNPATAGGRYQRNSAAFGVWSRTVAASDPADAGWLDTTGTTINTRTTANVFGARLNQSAVLNTAATVTDGSGLYAVNRSGAGAVEMYRNGASIQTGTNASTALVSNNLYYGRAAAASYSTVEFAAGLGGGSLTAAEQTSLYNALQTYMTAVGA